LIMSLVILILSKFDMTTLVPVTELQYSTTIGGNPMHSLTFCRVLAVNIFLLLAKVVAYAATGSRAVLASLADSAGTPFVRPYIENFLDH
jgi:hypothetical protein